MDIALIEMIMEVAGISQSKIQYCEENSQEELPSEILKKYNINNQLYTIYRVPKCQDEQVPEHLWTFYQSILYFLQKDYFMASEEMLLKQYESFIVKFKNDIEKMFYVTQQKIELDPYTIKDKEFLKILSRYIELKIIILNSEEIEFFPEENTKNKKIVIFEKNNVYFPVVDNRFQGYEFVNDLMVEQEHKQIIVTTALTEPMLKAMNKDKLIETAFKHGIEVNKQGKTKIISKTRTELISEILKYINKK